MRLLLLPFLTASLTVDHFSDVSRKRFVEISLLAEVSLALGRFESELVTAVCMVDPDLAGAGKAESLG